MFDDVSFQRHCLSSFSVLFFLVYQFDESSFSSWRGACHSEKIIPEIEIHCAKKVVPFRYD